MQPFGADPPQLPEHLGEVIGLLTAFITGFFMLLTALVKRRRVIVHRYEQAPPQRRSGVLGVLLLLIAMVLGGILCAQEEDRTRQARSRLGDLDTALQRYRAERGYFPRTLEELVEQGGPDGAHFLWRGYAGLYDPWGKHFEYYPNDVQLTGRPRVQTIRKYLRVGEPRTFHN